MFQRRRKKTSLLRASCVLLGAFFSASMITLLLYSDSKTFSTNYKILSQTFTMYPKELTIKRPPLRFSHLQPLRDMFANLTIMEPNKSDCMVGSAEFSDLTELEKKTPVLLLIIVSTAPSRQDRREAIRQTWGTKCGGEVVCKFFTDGIQITKEDQEKLLREKQVYKDLEFQPIVGGRTFGLRYLYHMMWAAAKYDFKYYLRLDDDYFVCLGRLRQELPHRPTKMLCWGHYHCNKNMQYVDEAWTLFTPDVIVRILSQDPQRMLCHPHADQELPIWMDSVFDKTENVTHFDDRRLHHFPAARTVERFKNLTNVCDSRMGIHGSSPELMHIFWKSGNDNAKEVTAITEVTTTCEGPFIFNISVMHHPFKFDLRPCIQNPQWTPGETMWGGMLSGAKKGRLPCS